MTEEAEQIALQDLEVTAATRRSKGLSVVWLVPLVALAIASWLLYKSWSEKGPLISITFKTAEGIKSNSSKIKYKDVEIGTVEAITFNQDMTEVVVNARMEKAAEEYLTDTTRFWIVRPRIAAGQVSGLGTLLSGSYIGIDPGRVGNPRRNFTGLDEAPIITADVPGRYLILKAEGLGSLDVGSPVYYRQIKVGQVIGYGFDDTGKSVDIRVFINAPHDQQITSNTRFWNASGIDLKLDATGIKLATESLASIVSGGIAFELPPHSRPGTDVATNAVFELYPSKSAVSEEKFQLKDSWLLYFNQSVRGLTVGAPVEFRGIKIGEVSSINLELDADHKNFRIPVIVTIEPERLFGSVQSLLDGDSVQSSLDEDSVQSSLDGGSAQSSLDGDSVQSSHDESLAKAEDDGCKIQPQAPGCPEPPAPARKPPPPPATPGKRATATGKTATTPPSDNHAVLKDFVARGLRAVLKNGNLLTGQLLIDFDFYPDEKERQLTFEDTYPVLPTRQTDLQQITESLSALLNKLEHIPFQQISQDIRTTLQTANRAIATIPVKEISADLRQTMQAAHAAMQQIEALSKTFDRQTAPALTSALTQLGVTLADLEASLGSDSPANHQLRQTMHEVSTAVRSMKGLTDYLERHPESLLYGKEKEQP